MTNICFSGGAAGADSLFGEEAKKAGHEVYHYHFNKNKQGLPHFYVLGEDKLKLADPYLKWANKTLKRGSFPYSNEFTNNMLRRNFYQVNRADSVYAITRLENGNVKGGTGWATQMACDRNTYTPINIYVFDMNTNHWYEWKKDKYVKWPKRVIGINSIPPSPTGKYAGIGSRELTEAGEKALRSLYL